jgi:hypothetical protein
MTAKFQALLARLMADETRAELEKKAEPEPDVETVEMSSMEDVAVKLIAWRQREGVSAKVIVRMALEIGYRSGYDAGANAWMDRA